MMERSSDMDLITCNHGYGGQDHSQLRNIKTAASLFMKMLLEADRSEVVSDYLTMQHLK